MKPLVPIICCALTASLAFASPAPLDSSSPVINTAKTIIPRADSDMKCTAQGVSVAPFCLPKKDSNKTVGDSLDFTWVTTDLADTEIKLMLRDVNKTNDKVIFTSSQISGSAGFEQLEADKNWLLKDQDRREIQVYLVYAKGTKKGSDGPVPGPSFWLNSKNFAMSNQEVTGKKKSNYHPIMGVICLLLILAFVGVSVFFFVRWMRRRKLGRFATTSRTYGERQSKAQREGPGWSQEAMGNPRYADNPGEQHEMPRTNN